MINGFRKSDGSIYLFKFLIVLLIFSIVFLMFFREGERERDREICIFEGVYILKEEIKKWI